MMDSLFSEEVHESGTREFTATVGTDGFWRLVVMNLEVVDE